MATRTTVDGAGRLVIPKPLRDRYGLTAGTEVEIVPVPDGITIVAVRKSRRMVRRGRVVAVDTDSGVAPIDAFDVRLVREEQLDAKTRIDR